MRCPWKRRRSRAVAATPALLSDDEFADIRKAADLSISSRPMQIAEALAA
jgi:hypothetical protein